MGQILGPEQKQQKSISKGGSPGMREVGDGQEEEEEREQL